VKPLPEHYSIILRFPPRGEDPGGGKEWEVVHRAFLIK